MGWSFGFSDDKETARVDEHASNPGAQDSSGIAAATAGAAAQEAERALQASPRKRGRPKKDGGNSDGNQRDLQAKVDDAIAAQLDALYAPEAWGALLAAPGDAMVALTGKEHWEVSKDERRTLGVTGSAAARTMMITNPKTLAFFMLGSAIFSVYGTRALKELKEWREKEKADARQKAAASS